MAFGLLAVKSGNPEKVLDLVSDYYKKLHLSLVEVVAGERESKYVKKRYDNLDDFRDAMFHDYKIESETQFDFYFNLKENSGWVAFCFSTVNYPARYNINVDEKLAIFLSNKLNTEVLKYYEVGTTGYISLSKYSNGKRTDDLFVEDSNYIPYGEGYFKDFKSKDFVDAPELYEKVLEPYYRKNNFYPSSDEFEYYHEERWRHFYLDGTREDIQKYLQRIKETL